MIGLPLILFTGNFLEVPFLRTIWKGPLRF